jgi:hypothetical protein
LFSHFENQPTEALSKRIEKLEETVNSIDKMVNQTKTQNRSSRFFD